MSTIKSSSEHLTLNADGASKDIKFQANGVEKASISSTGAFTSTTIDATVLTGALPAISGASLTGISIGANAVGVSELNLSDGSANQYLQTDGNGTISFASISSGATGGGTDEVFVNNSQTITTDYTVPVGKSASSTGPITMNAGVDITLSAGSRWVIL